MRRKRLLTIGAVVLAASCVTAYALISQGGEAKAPAVAAPNEAAPLVLVARATSVNGAERSFTGTVAARVQSNVGFRVPGKIVERLVDVGQQVQAGQPLMRMDDSDLRLALAAKHSAVVAAKAVLVQAVADERRMAALVAAGRIVSDSRYDLAKAALDTAEAQLAAAQAEAEFAENEVSYSILVAGADGTIVATLGEPGQVVAAGQTVLQLAHAGPREAMIALPETIRPQPGSHAEASVYGSTMLVSKAHLRLISDAANGQTRTYEARYVLEGDAASAPLGATVTVRITDEAKRSEALIPIAAVLDDGNRTGVWALNRATSTVHFTPIEIRQLSGETAIVTGLEQGQEVVALGAHLLSDGASVRTNVQAQEVNG